MKLSGDMRALLAWALDGGERTFVVETTAGEWGGASRVYRHARMVHGRVVLGDAPAGKVRNTWSLSLRGLERRGFAQRSPLPGLPAQLYQRVTITPAGVREARRLGLSTTPTPGE